MNTGERLKKLDAELASLEGERERRAPSAADVEKAMAERAAKIEALEAKINEVEDRVFDEFSKKVRL